MTRDERIDALLARGYFPKELPPPFTTSVFAQTVASIVPGWAAYEAGLTPQQRRQYPPITNYARFDMARKGQSRRTLGVVNPISQYHLVSAIADHQDEFEAISGRSRISLTSAEITDGNRRAVSMPKLSLLSEKRIEAYGTARAILRTDVLSFYHAIYTHSVPWALHGKRAIFFETRTPRGRRRYEVLGEDYGSDEAGALFGGWDGLIDDVDDVF